MAVDDSWWMVVTEHGSGWHGGNSTQKLMDGSWWILVTAHVSGWQLVDGGNSTWQWMAVGRWW